MPRKTLRTFGGIGLAFALVMITGCPARAPVGEVTGRVTFEDKPVTEGTVSFMNPDVGTGDEARLSADGVYTLKKPLAVGNYKVTVLPLIVRLPATAKGPDVEVEKAAPDIPERYRRDGSTTLTAAVKEGKNEINFNMKR